MEAIVGLPLPLTVLPKGVEKDHKSYIKVTYVYVKCVKAKPGVTSHVSVPDYGRTDAINCKCCITPDINPQKG